MIKTKTLAQINKP